MSQSISFRNAPPQIIGYANSYGNNLTVTTVEPPKTRAERAADFPFFFTPASWANGSERFATLEEAQQAARVRAEQGTYQDIAQTIACVGPNISAVSITPAKKKKVMK